MRAAAAASTGVNTLGSEYVEPHKRASLIKAWRRRKKLCMHCCDALLCKSPPPMLPTADVNSFHDKNQEYDTSRPRPLNLVLLRFSGNKTKPKAPVGPGKFAAQSSSFQWHGRQNGREGGTVLVYILHAWRGTFTARSINKSIPHIRTHTHHTQVANGNGLDFWRFAITWEPPPLPTVTNLSIALLWSARRSLERAV